MTPTSKPAILLLHGAWHGAWCWEAVARVLTAAGHVVSAIDLPGGGLRGVEPKAFASADPASMGAERTALGDLSAAEYAATAQDALAELYAAHGPVVVVGHSPSGVVLHRLGEAAPEQIHRLVYLAALTPAPGNTVFGDAGGPAFADSLFLALPASDPGGDRRGPHQLALPGRDLSRHGAPVLLRRRRQRPRRHRHADADLRRPRVALHRRADTDHRAMGLSTAHLDSMHSRLRRPCGRSGPQHRNVGRAVRRKSL